MIEYHPYKKVDIATERDGAFLSDLRFEFPDIPTPTLVNYVVRAATRLAQIGNVCRRKAYIHTQQCITRYIIEPPDCVDIVNIMSICATCGDLCGGVTRVTGEPCRLSCGNEMWFERPNIVHFSRLYGHYIYEVEFSVKPKMFDCEIDEVFFNHYYETLMSGARYYAFSVPSKPWSSDQKAAKANTDFELGIRAAALDTLTGHQRGVMKTKRNRVL